MPDRIRNWYMMKQVNNKILSVLVLVAMSVSLAGTFATFSLIQREVVPVTGFYSGITNVTVVRLAAVDVIVALVDFHDMVQTATNETSDYDPHPFVLQNNGTVFVNISIYSEDLWPSAAPNPDQYYRFNASDDNATNSALSSIQLGWVAPWTDMAAAAPSNPNLATCVNNSPNANTINVHINITVPTLASSGTHTATVTFTGADPGQDVCGAGT